MYRNMPNCKRHKIYVFVCNNRWINNNLSSWVPWIYDNKCSNSDTLRSSLFKLLFLAHQSAVPTLSLHQGNKEPEIKSVLQIKSSYIE